MLFAPEERVAPFVFNPSYFMQVVVVKRETWFSRFRLVFAKFDVSRTSRMQEHTTLLHLQGARAGHNPTGTGHRPMQTRYNQIQTGHRPIQTRYNPIQTDHSSIQTGHSPIQMGHSSIQTGHSPISKHDIAQAVTNIYQFSLFSKKIWDVFRAGLSIAS